MRDGEDNFNKLDDPLPFRSTDFARSAVFATSHFTQFQLVCAVGVAALAAAAVGLASHLSVHKELEMAVMEHDARQCIAVVLRALEGGVCSLEEKMDEMIEKGWKMYPKAKNQLEFAPRTKQIEFSLETDSHEVRGSERRGFPNSRTTVVELKRPASDSDLVLHVRPAGGDDVDTYHFESLESGGSSSSGGGGAVAAAVGVHHVPAALSAATKSVCATQLCPFSSASMPSQTLLQILHQKNIKDWTCHQVASFLLFELKINETFVKYLHDSAKMTGVDLIYATIAYLKTLPQCPEEPTLLRLMDMVAHLKGVHGSSTSGGTTDMASTEEEIALPDIEEVKDLMCIHLPQIDPVSVPSDKTGHLLRLKALLKGLNDQISGAADLSPNSSGLKRLKERHDRLSAFLSSAAQKAVDAIDAYARASPQAVQITQEAVLKTLQESVNIAVEVWTDSFKQPLNSRLNSIKDLLAHFVHTLLTFCDRSQLNAEFLDILSQMVVEPAMMCMRETIERMLEDVRADSETYLEQMHNLAVKDKSIYNDVFDKLTDTKYGGCSKIEKGDFDNMLLVIDSLRKQWKMSKSPPRRQPRAEVLPLMCLCMDTMPLFQTVVRKMFSGVRAIRLQFRSETKSLYRQAEKAFLKGPAAQSNPGNLPDPKSLDCSNICDIVGCLVDCDDFKAMREVIEKLKDQKEATIYDIKDRWGSASGGGWRDLICILAIGPENLLCEVQVVHSKMLIARKGGREGLDAHKAYSKYRSYSEMLSFAGITADSASGGGSAAAAAPAPAPAHTPAPAPAVITGGGSATVAAPAPAAVTQGAVQAIANVGAGTGGLTNSQPPQGKKSRPSKFVAPAMRLGNATQTAAGLADLMGYTNMTIMDHIRDLGQGDQFQAIVNEIELRGTSEDKNNLRGLLDGTFQQDPPAETPEEIAAEKRTLDELMDTYEVRTAKLTRAHVLALRLYTTSTYTSINDPLRTVPPTQPHPLAATAYLISDGLKLLRAVVGGLPGAHEPQTLWRGMKDLSVSDEFRRSGGTEFACMSTSASQEVAVDFAESKAPMILKLETKDFLSRGADISFLSVYAGESETLFPPLTFLRPIAPDGVTEHLKINNTDYLLVRVEPVLP